MIPVVEHLARVERILPVCAALIVLAGSAHAELRPRIVNGVPTSAFPAVGALLSGGDPGSARLACSGTLIGCATFLTAGHCVSSKSPSGLWVYLPSAGVFAVSAFTRHPGYQFPAADVAVIHLADAVAGISPAAIATSGAPPFGSAGTIVGYGRSGGTSPDYGLERAGDVVTGACSDIPPPGSDETSVCWTYAAPIGPPGSDSNTCNGDSGGPLLVDLGAGPVVAGITSGGSSEDCLPTDQSYDASVFAYRDFIQAQGGADLASTSCGTIPQVGRPGTQVAFVGGTLSVASPAAVHVFEIPPGTTIARVALNARDDGLADFDLYVRSESPPEPPSVYDCRRDGAGQFGVCELTAPPAGPLYAVVTRASGAGDYQLTATTFGRDCARPGSAGQPCDDGDDCTLGDLCTGGACIGAAAADDTPCDDGDPCSQPDVCQTGACAGASPALGCKRPTAPGASSLQLLARGGSADRLTWRWRRGAATSSAELGRPDIDTGYALCLYDETAGVPQRKLRLTMPAGPGWKATARGFKHRATGLPQGSRLAVEVKSGEQGRAQASVTGRGPALGLPGLPFAQQDALRVQLLDGQACWEADFGTSRQNQTDRFLAVSD